MADRKDSPKQVVPGYSVSPEIQESIPQPLPLPMGNEGLSDTVFNLLFKDLIACENIRTYMENIQNEVYGQGLTHATFERRMCQLADQYISAVVTSDDKAVIIRYITAFAKIENNVKANLSALAVAAELTIPADLHDPNGLNPSPEIIEKYKAVQEMINKWAHAYGVRHSLEPSVIHTPNLDLGKWVTY
ncbi:hypothetical protein PP175_15405 [Aneurinibacillus sp. Ricciae_BoGa-3]|uniref:hypothetical protein n=1 Tax=Aneurinibacillus sp. Ricciae_BoGa-3 TaxID=3022697 RepID=UPI002340F831|nr:hypothetical protein [Aneurinibacillus sp. Ricciae_BoGa-3]WCK52807.1 hypothetical protein PP175_15405 [Aneurinibacillus sp. Ricciae_BoGa-3]